ncbi:MAG: DsbA family protein [Alphaproteobacteria bacterium]
MTFKSLALATTALSLGLMATAPATLADDAPKAPAAAEVELQPLTKSDIETIIRDYLMENPEIVMDAAAAYRVKQEQERAEAAKAALTSESAAIYEDPLSPAIGPDDADVTVVEFFDYNCGYCKRILPDMVKLTENDPKVRIIFKEMPILGPTSIDAAKAALAAQKQGKYFEMHAALMENREGFAQERINQIASDLGLDVEQLQADMQSAEFTAYFDRVRELAGKLGVTGTPALIVGEEIAPGAIPYDRLKEMVATAREAG